MRRRRCGEKEQWMTCRCYSCGENFAGEKVGLRDKSRPPECNITTGTLRTTVGMPRTRAVVAALQMKGEIEVGADG